MLAATTFLAAFGVVATLEPRGEADMTAPLMRAVDMARSVGGGTVCLAAGAYHFRSPAQMSFYVSNHDNPMPRNVFLPITNITDFVLSCEGRAEFVFHGEGIGIELMDAKNVRLRGFDMAFCEDVDIQDQPPD